MNVFVGGGIGRLGIDKEMWRDGKKVKGPRCIAYNLETGINVVFWKVGLYYVTNYLYAQKKEDNKKAIDFNDSGFFF